MNEIECPRCCHWQAHDDDALEVICDLCGELIQIPQEGHD